MLQICHLRCLSQDALTDDFYANLKLVVVDSVYDIAAPILGDREMEGKVDTTCQWCLSSSLLISASFPPSLPSLPPSVCLLSLPPACLPPAVGQALLSHFSQSLQHLAHVHHSAVLVRGYVMWLCSQATVHAPFRPDVTIWALRQLPCWIYPALPCSQVSQLYIHLPGHCATLWRVHCISSFLPVIYLETNLTNLYFVCEIVIHDLC